jgi:hypothetical protein
MTWIFVALAVTFCGTVLSKTTKRHKPKLKYKFKLNLSC